MRSRSIDHTTEMLASIHRQVSMDFYCPARTIGRMTAFDGSSSLQFITAPLINYVSLVDYEAINNKTTTLNNVASVFAQQLRRSIPNCSAACTLAITKHFPTLASLFEFARGSGKQPFVRFISELERGDDDSAAAAQSALAHPDSTEEAAIAALFAQTGVKKRQKLGPQFARFLYTFLAEQW